MENDIKKILENHEERLRKLEGAPVKRKISTSTSVTVLLQRLAGENYFSQERTPVQILDKFAELGHTYKRVQSLTGALQRATKNGILKRKKTSDGWVYLV